MVIYSWQTGAHNSQFAHHMLSPAEVWHRKLAELLEALFSSRRSLVNMRNAALRHRPITKAGADEVRRLRSQHKRQTHV